MNVQSPSYGKHALLTVLFFCANLAGLPSHAAVTELADVPLAQATTATVRPNLFYILDDSGSMMQQYTPDYVSDRWGDGSDPGDWHCLDSGDDTDTKRDKCLVGDPPYMSSDFNTQYYNPATRYSPPVKYDGTLFPSMSAANTTNWTAVKTDGFNRQNTNQLEQSATTVNLTTAYPERAWCDTTARDHTTDTTNCKTNSSGYSYPNGTYSRGKDSSGNIRYKYGSPYYFAIAAKEYCTNTNLTTCIIADAPTGIYTIPAKVRWCDSAALTNCQAKKTGTFQYSRFSNTTSAVSQAKGTIVIGDSGSNDAVSITGVTIDGVNIIGSTISAPTGTNSSTERNTTATALATAINSFNSTPEYIACAGSACAPATNSDTVVITPTIASGSTTPLTGTAPNGRVITVLSPSTGTTAATSSVAFSSTGTNGSVTSITVNGVEILNQNIAASGANTTERNKNMAKDVCNRIDSYLNTTPFEYAGGSSSTNTSCPTNSATFYIQAPLAQGSAPNGYAIVISTSGTISYTVGGTSTMNSGVSTSLPTTVTNISGGGDGISSFSRINIVPATATYSRAANRLDCVASASACSYDEEMTNFANWYAYYRTRMQMMKSSSSQAFLPLNDNYRVGFYTINTSSVAKSITGSSPDRYSSTEFLDIANFDATQKEYWYNTLFRQSPTGSTPLRGALSKAGKIFQKNLTGAADPVQYSCQQNFSLLTTDGYWNETYSGVGDQDNTDSGYSTRAVGAYDGNIGASNTLADVAMYYYKNDLRPTGTTGVLDTDVSKDNVPTSDKDPAPHQHMITFTLGLGVDGVMTYRSDYETATSGDFYNIKTASTGCAWTTGTCNWPLPANNTDTAVDDLWHAAVNGRGHYFSARDPVALASGLSDALSSIKIITGAAAASATSSPNITQTDNSIYSTFFRTLKWDGEVKAQSIDPGTGDVIATVNWSAQTLLDAKALDSSDTRTIYTLDTGTGQFKAFSWANLDATEKAFFNNKSSTMSQYATLDAAQKLLADNGENLVNYLRGQTGYEGILYRDREHILGDTVNAKPAYVALPKYNFNDTDYADFKTDQAARQAMLYIAANDGMLHAFNANPDAAAGGGGEVWAYVPRMIMSNLYQLANDNYSNNHHFFVDGTPETMDVYIGGAWKTILVGGLNKGGRGYYALDITNPNNPAMLWETCSDSTLCTNSDTDLGYSYGNPVITKRPSDGKWVVLVSSGHNNVSPGTGKAFLFVLDAADGSILTKIDTNFGSTSDPAGLSMISGWSNNPNTDNKALRVYGGDLYGNLWRFDLTTNSVIKLAELKDGSSNTQPVTTRPELGICGTSTEMVFVGTGRYLGLNDALDTSQQSFYALKDSTVAWGNPRATLIVEQVLTAASTTARTITTNPVDLSIETGWFMDFNPANDSPGERVTVDPQLVLGTMLIATNVPKQDACSTGGDSWFYQLDYCTGSYISTSAVQSIAANKITGSLTVGFVVIRLPDGTIKTIVTSASGDKQTKGVDIGGGGATGKRVSWREVLD